MPLPSDDLGGWRKRTHASLSAGSKGRQTKRIATLCRNVNQSGPEPNKAPEQNRGPLANPVPLTKVQVAHKNGRVTGGPDYGTGPCSLGEWHVWALGISLASPQSVMGLVSAFRPPVVGLDLLYTSDPADQRSRVDLGGRRYLKKKNKQAHPSTATTR